MEHISAITEKDAIEVRIANMDKQDNPIPALIEELLKISDYKKRQEEIEKFNNVSEQ